MLKQLKKIEELHGKTIISWHYHYDGLVLQFNDKTFVCLEIDYTGCVYESESGIVNVRSEAMEYPT
jgi:hypothetical protein